MKLQCIIFFISSVVITNPLFRLLQEINIVNSNNITIEDNSVLIATDLDYLVLKFVVSRLS